MNAPFFDEHWLDENGNPAGGVSTGTGFTISWQNGPLAVNGDRKDPNGAFVETIIEAVIKRIEFYQASRFNCIENANALEALKHAAECLDSRTKNREARGVEGTHKV
jgi:hypothetical protein